MSHRGDRGMPRGCELFEDDKPSPSDYETSEDDEGTTTLHSEEHHGNLFQDLAKGMDEIDRSKKAQEACCSEGLGLGALSIASIAVGVLVLKQAEGWETITSLYVITQVMTTIGYGDLPIKSPFAQLFMTVYVLWCLVLLAHALSFFMMRLMDETNNRVRDRLQQFESSADEQKAKEQKLKMKPIMDLVKTGQVFLFFVLFGTAFFGFIDRTSNDCELDSGGECDDACFPLFEDCPWDGGDTIIEAFYMSIITLTTVGFGDFTPKSNAGRIMGIFWMCGGVCAAGAFIGAIQNLLFISSQDAGAMAQAEDIERDEFSKIDAMHGEGDGKVTRGEFQTYMLKKFQLVEEDILDHVNGMYDRLEAISKQRLGDDSAQDEVIFDDVIELRRQNDM